MSGWIQATMQQNTIYADISWESRWNIEINIWGHFYKILLVFEVPYRPRVKGMLKLPKVGKGCLKLSLVLWFRHYEIVCVGQIGLGLTRTL